MNKKGALGLIIGIIILTAFLLVVLFYFIIGPDALLQKLASGADWIADKTLAGSNKDKLNKVTVESDKGVEEYYENIISALRVEGNGPCLLSYKPLTNDFNGFKITLSKVEQGIFVELINKKEQSVPGKSNTISGKLPCVVGEGNAAQNFYNNYLKGVQCEPNCQNDYSTANIEFRDSGNIYVNGQKRSLKDGNLLFKTKDGNVCFFPTYFGWFTSIGCDADKTGLDDDCINQIKDRIPECSKLKEWSSILQDYKKNKCEVNKYTCKVENLGCQCFSAGLYQSKQKPEICTEKEPYCYDGVEGCSDKGPDNRGYLEVCKQTIGDKFQLAPKCEVDKNTCKVKNAPCSCYTADSKIENKPYVCFDEQYCYNEQVGCRNEASNTPLYEEYCQKSIKT